MLNFINETNLNSQELSNEILNYYRANKDRETFFEDVDKFLLNVTQIENENLTPQQISLIEKSFTDFNQDNILFDNYHEYLKLDCALTNFKYKFDNIKSKKNVYFEMPLSAYEYRGNNRTSFLKNERLPYLLYK